MISLQPREFYREDYVISTDPSRLDLPWIHNYLSNDAYWSRGITFQVFRKSVENSLCFGVYHQATQVGFGRAISDLATFAYLSDVFIAESYRRRGLGKWLVDCILGYPELQGLRRWMLATTNAHGLYKQYGFTPLRRPESIMEIINLDF